TPCNSLNALRGAVVMCMLLVVLGLVLANMPAAVAARRCFFVAGVAIKRSALEELLQANLVVLGEIAGILRQRHRIAAAIAGLRTQAREQRHVMIVGPAADLARAVAQWASHA